MAFKLLQAMKSSLRKVRALRETAEPRNPYRRGINYSGRTQAGVTVYPENSLQQSTIWAGNRYLSQTVAQLPIRVMRTEGEKGRQVLGTPTDNVLNWRVNPELSPFHFKETMVSWALLYGNGVAEIETDKIGRLKNLWPLHPRRVQLLRDVDTGELIYRIAQGAGYVGQGDNFVDLTSSQVFHLRGLGDGPVGMSVIEYAAQSIGWARATELFGASFFGEGLHFGGAVILGGEADKETLIRVREELDEQHKGVGRAGRWALLDGKDTKLQKMAATPNEAQFVETMQFQVEEICRWIGVPPQKVYHLLRMTNNNVEHLSIEVVVDSITPWVIRFEEECNAKLFGQNRGRFYVKLDMKGLLRGDFASRQTGLQVMRRNGVINSDMWAELEDMKPPGSTNGGDIYIVEGNMTKQQDVGEVPVGNGTGTPGTPSPEPSAEGYRALSDATALLGMELGNVGR